MTNHTPFLKRLTDLTRAGSIVWTHSPEASEYVAHVDNYTARLASSDDGRSSSPALRFALYSRNEKVVDIGARKSGSLQSSDDAGYTLKALFDAVERQQTSRETSAFEDFLSRAEA